MNRNVQLVCVFLFLTVSVVYTEVVHWRPCSYPDNPDAPSNCTIHELRVEPCKEAPEGKPCKIKKGLVGNVTFDYTPDFGGDLEGRVYWASQLLDIPFLGMDANACMATTCPALPGQRSTYQIGLAISKKYPVRMYDLKWKLWNKENQECCFMFQIKLTK